MITGIAFGGPSGYLARMLRFTKVMRRVVIGFGIVALALVIILAASVMPLDRTVDRSYLAETMHKTIDTLHHTPGDTMGFRIGFAKVNLTPPHPTATAGYATRHGRAYTSVRDSVYIRTLVIDNGRKRVAIVSADLLIVPPTVTALLEKELPATGFTLDNTYLGAIHSHNSVGNWGKGAAAFIYGSYNDSIVHFIADKITASVRLASANMLPATISAGTVPIAEAVRNRLIDDGPVDSLMRVIQVKRSDSTRLLLMSYTAHATCLDDEDLALSRDYPGKLIDAMEGNGYNFAMFMAGAVGSHAARSPEGGESCVNWMADVLSRRVLEAKNYLAPLQGQQLDMHRVPLLLPNPQVKVSKHWCLRPWLFESAFGDYPEFLTVLRIGDLVMLGTPCDFSGEFDRKLDALATRHGVRTMVTSFNGGYIGYVTPSEYYDEDHSETRLMSWYGIGNGEYIEQCLEHLLTAETQ